MSTKNYSFHIGDIEFVVSVSIAKSIESTNAYRGDHGASYVFAVGSVFQIHHGNANLVSDESETYNAIVWLQALEKMVAQPALLPSHATVERLKVSEWFDKYWQLIDDEATTDADEALYDRLSIVSVEETRYSRLLIYRDDANAEIECVSNLRDDKKRVVQTSTFSPSKCAADIRGLREQIEKEVFEAVAKAE